MQRLLFGVIPIYGLLIAGAMALGVFLCARQEKRLGLPKDTAIDFALWVLPAAVVGVTHDCRASIVPCSIISVSISRQRALCQANWRFLALFRA